MEFKLKENEAPFDLYFFNNNNENKSYLSNFNIFESNNEGCEFCKLKKCQFCRVDDYMNVNQNIYNLISFNKNNKEQSFLVNFKSHDREKFCKDLIFPLEENTEKILSCNKNNNEKKK
jgi:hypothetical protein